MPKESPKREKFIRLAEGRTEAALNAIRKIGNLSNKRAYDYDEADIRKITKALRDAINEVEGRFSPTGSRTDKFKL